MRKIIFIVFVLIIALNVKGQEWNYARLSILYGSSIPFNFNSIAKYRTGIEISEGTILGISLADSSVVGHTLQGFDLNLRTFNGATVIQGESSTINLNRIRVKAESYIGLGTGTTNGYQDLSAAWNTLFTYTNLAFTNLTWDNHQLSISYECGKPVSDGGNGTLLGEEPDHYTVELEIELIPTGPGF